MRWFQTTWTVRFNRFHGLNGHLFQGRYKAVIVDPEERDYFVTLSDYIHLNPIRAGLVQLRDKLFNYSWSSYPSYLDKPSTRPCWLRTVRALSLLSKSVGSLLLVRRHLVLMCHE